MGLRDARSADLPAIVAIYNTVVRNSTAAFTEADTTLAEREAWLANRQAQGYPVLVAFDEDTQHVVGFGSFGEFRSWPGYRHTVEHSVYVDAAARRHGLGTALVVALIERARSLGKHTMIAGIDAANQPSITMHEKLGFVRCGVMREVATKWGQWLDLLFMQRLL